VKAVSRFIVKLADLAEAEGRALRAGAAHVGLAAAVALAGAMAGLAGIGFLIWALFEALRPGLGLPGAAAVCGVLLLLAAGGLLWTVKKMAR
jgi:hypothetical protein